MPSDPDVIANHEAAASREPSRWSTPGRRAVLDLIVIPAAAVVLILANGGRPYSNWFYAVLGVALVARGYERFKGKPEPKLPCDPPMEKSAAMREAIWQGISTAVLFYALMLTVFGYVRQWPVAIIIGALMGSNYYHWYRGRKPSWKYFAVISAVALILIAGLVILKALHG